MSWHFSQALVAAYSADTSSGGAPCAPSSGNPTPLAFLCSDRMTVFSRLSRFWDDVRTFDGRPYRGRIDVVSGGFPCQDISAAGKGAGIDGERSGMWAHMARIIREVGPRYAFVENSPVLTSRGLGVVLGDLAALGYDARWGVLGAIDAGAPHKRERIWIVAESRSAGAGSVMGEAGDSHGRASGKYVPPLRQAHGANGSNRTDPASESADAADAAGYGRGQGIKNGAGGSEGMGARPQQRPRDGRGNVADTAGTQDHAKRGDCECGRDSMGRNQETSQQDERAPDHDGSCGCRGDVGNAPCIGRHEEQTADDLQRSRLQSEARRSSGANGGSWWASEPDVGRVAHGVAARVDRLKAIGNGQVPSVAALAWRILSQ